MLHVSVILLVQKDPSVALKNNLETQRSEVAVIQAAIQQFRWLPPHLAASILI